MTLTDLSTRYRIVLYTLYQQRAATRASLAEACALKAQEVSSVLNRLEGFGFVTRQETLSGGAWGITAEGDQLFIKPAPVEPAPKPQDAEPGADQSPPQPAPEPPTPLPEDPPVVTPDVILQEQELNIALDELIARIHPPRISASTLRVYRRLLGALPSPVQQALSQITALVEAQP